MQSIITMELLAAVSDKGFSLDELIVQLGRVSQDQGLPGIAVMILRLVDELLWHDHLSGRAWPGTSCCSQAGYESLGMTARQVRTSIGLLEFSWRRYRCTACGQTRVPLRDLLGLTPRQAKSNELEQVVVEVATDQSYRRSSRHLETIGGIPVPKSTAHRWVVQTDSDRIEPAGGRFDSLLADGTGYKRRPEGDEDPPRAGELRMAIGISSVGQVSALGAWSGRSWQQIAEELGRGQDPDRKLARMLVSDGEPGLAEALGPLTDRQQRCLWHLTHDLDPMLWRDGAGRTDRRQRQKELAGIVKIDLPRDDGQPVAAADRGRIEQQMHQAEAALTQFVERLTQQGYHQAAGYVRQAQSRLFSYVRFWLKHGIVNPKVSSFIERLMREVGRRLKRIAFGWTDFNAAKMARLILKRITDPAEWEQYWKKKLRLEGNVIIAFRGVRSSSAH